MRRFVMWPKLKKFKKVKETGKNKEKLDQTRAL